MSSHSLDAELSSAELRSKLFHSFKSKGVVQSVKTQLRKQLALDLHEKALKRGSTKHNHLCDDGVLFQRICNSLIVDHMKRCLYDYTLSVFISETSSNLDQTIPLLDILDLLQIQRNSNLYEVLSSACTYSNNTKSFLWTFLAAIAKEPRNPTSTRECSIQTEETRDIFNLDRKMLEIEKLQMDKLQNSIKGDYESVQEKLMVFQRQYERKKHEELKVEMERFRATELSNMRIEEREKHQNELLGMRAEYEAMYSSKLKCLERRESEVHAKSLYGEKELEREAYEQRQNVLEEMDALKQRDLEMKREHQSAMLCVEAEERRLEAKEDELKTKEKSIQEMEEYYDNKIKQETLKMKVEYQEKELERTRMMDAREHELKDEILTFESQKRVYLQWKDEADRLGKDNQQVRAFIEKSKQSYETLNEKYKIVSLRCERVADYEDTKNNNILLEKDLEVCKMSFAELTLRTTQEKGDQQKLVKELIAKISHASFENENKFRQLQEEERAVTLKYHVLQTKNDILQKKHTVQLKKNEELQKLYEQVLISQRELLCECDALKLELQFGRQEREKPVPPQQNFSKTKLLISNTIQDQDEKASVLRNNKKKVRLPEVAEEDMGSRIDIEESNQVLQRLEEEALELEKSYKKFQVRQRHIKSQLPQYIEKTKVAIETTTMEMQRSYDNYREELVNASQTLQTVQSDSFNISHLIPSRRVPESTIRRSAPKYSMPVSSSETSALNAQTLTSSFRVTELNPLLTTNSFPKFTPTAFATRADGELIALVPNDMRISNEVPLVETIISLTQSPLGQSIQPLKSLTQMPLTETIQPMASLNQMSVPGTPQFVIDQPMNSLTQIPLTETMCQIEENRNNFVAIPPTDIPIRSAIPIRLTDETVGNVNMQQSLTQIPLTETLQATSSLTQIPLSDTICRLEENKSNYATKPTTSASEDGRKDENVGKINPPGWASQTPSASALRKTLSHIETYGPEMTSCSNLQTDDFSPLDPFKTSDFMLKGFQSTELVRENEYGQSADGNVAFRGSYSESKEKYLQDIPVEGNVDKDVQVENVLDISQNSRNVDSWKIVVSADSEGIIRQPSHSEQSAKTRISMAKNARKTEDSKCKTLSRGEDTDKDVHVESVLDLSQSSKNIDFKKIVSADSEGIIHQPSHSEPSAKALVSMAKSVEEIGSAGEVGVVSENSGGEQIVEEAENPMNQYMQMILEKRKTDSDDIFDDDGAGADAVVEKQTSAVYDDISLSNSEGRNQDSEPLSSDFEW